MGGRQQRIITSAHLGHGPVTHQPCHGQGQAGRHLLTVVDDQTAPSAATACTAATIVPSSQPITIRL